MIGIVKRKKRGRKIPMPGLVLPGNWIVAHTDEGGATSYDPVKKIARMEVDTRSTEKKARFVRKHEMGHARFSPWDAFNCDPMSRSQIYAGFLNGFEDCRIHELMARAGVFVKEEETKEMVEELKANWSNDQPAWAIASCLATGGPHTPLSFDMFYDLTMKAVEAEMPGRGYKIALTIRRMSDIVTRKPKFDLVQKFAKACERMFQREAEKEDPEDNELEEEELRSEEKLDELDLHEEDGDDEVEEGGPNDPAFSEYHSWWGKMTVVRKDLVMPFAKKLVEDRRIRPSEIGCVPKFIYRDCIDGMIFAKVRKDFGRAVVLIDNSGSMGLTKEQLEDLMLRAPGCLVACYSGDGVKGVLTILADDGKRIGTMPPSLGSNTVDGPALEWLGSQKAAIRIWISDGYVNGHRGSFVNLLKDARDKVRTHKIRHVLSVEDAKSLLKKTFGLPKGVEDVDDE